MSNKPGDYLGQVMSIFGLGQDVDHEEGAARIPQQGRAHAAPSNARAENTTAQEGRDPREFEARLDEITAHQGVAGGITAGRVHMLNLNKVRERLGGRWKRFAERIHAVIKGELKTRLGPRDLFTCVDDSTYVIVFGDCSEVEARLRVALLSEQILEKLLGEAEAKDLSALGVQRVVAQADGGLVTEAVDRTQALKDVIDQAEAEGVATYDVQDVLTGKRALSTEEVDHLLGNVERDLRAVEQDNAGTQTPAIKIDSLRHVLKELKEIELAMATAEPASRPAPAEGQPNNGVTWVEQASPMQTLIREMKARAERQIVVLEGVQLREEAELSGSADDDAPLDLQFSYLPMWHGPSQKIGIYRCQTTVRAADGTIMKPPQEAQDQQADFWAIVDRLTLRRARDDMRKAIERRVFNGILVPVHFSTIRRHGSRGPFLELCTNIPKDFRKFLLWEIRACPINCWSTDLAEAVDKIAPFGRAVFLTVEDFPASLPAVKRSLPALRGAGVQKLGLDASALGESEAEVLRLLETMAKLAEANRLKCYGDGFHSLSLTICAVCMGYEYLSGAPIADAMAEPQGIQATEMEAIYGRALADKALEAE